MIQLIRWTSASTPTIEVFVDGEPAGVLLDRDARSLPVDPGSRKLGSNPRPATILALKGDVEKGEALFFNKDMKCANCHTVGDRGKQLGPDLTAIGKNRTKDLAGRPVDNLVRLPTGEAAHGIPAFSNYLVAERKNDFIHTLCKKLLGFALGRSLEISDKALIERMETDLGKNEYRFTRLVETIVLSPQFRTQRGKDYPSVIDPSGEKP